ncbi:glycosyltransferase family 17 protein [Phellopilus nigrolimitatus]|nr:glycosyltransferase family 17 protein [Phellopilus nigrolimitatus]
MPLLRRHRLFLIPAVLFVLSLVYLWSQYHYQIHNALSYATRPLWDHADGPTDIIPHYFVDGMSMDERACSLHGWQLRPAAAQVHVLDAVLMSSELDLLEVRLNELDTVVDRFFIVESNATFTGLPKETYFAFNRERFAKFEHKIEYHFFPGYPLEPGQDAWHTESDTRDFMTRHLTAYVATLPATAHALVVMADIDELPAAHTLALLRACDFGAVLHLQLRSYLYSFEWALGGTPSWRASVHRFVLPRRGAGAPATYYRHSLSTSTALADAGWHCSYCFRTLPEYTAKMRGFSHADRIGGDLRLLDERRIQKVICKGADIFGMLPEAYSYGELLAQMYIQPSRSAVHIPRFIVENAERFRFLLPGGCIREGRSHDRSHRLKPLLPPPPPEP